MSGYSGIVLDSHNMMMGRTHQSSDRRIAAYDKNGKLLGYYDPTANRSYDAQGRYLGTGNQTTAMMGSAR